MSNTGAFQYWQRSMIQAGPGTVLRLPSLFSSLGGKRVALISDPGLVQAGLVDKISRLFTDEALPGAPKLVAVITDTAPDAESGSVNRALQQVRASAADSILAVGGGSVLDSAKLIKLAMYKQVSDVQELMKLPLQMLKWPEVSAMGIPHIAVPTTAGTGAEITNGAVIYNQELGIKHLIFADYMEADIAVLDAHMSTGLPPHLTAATGMDALTHALEVIAHPRANDFALAHAMTSAKIILDNLPKAVANGNDLMARQHMLNASAMACNSLQADMGPFPVHNFSHAFGSVFHIHHGEANAVLLPAVLEVMPEFYAPVADRLGELFGLSNEDPRSLVLSVAVKIRELLELLGHPQNFSRHNLLESKQGDIVQAIAQDTLSAFYPLPAEAITAVVRRVCVW